MASSMVLRATDLKTLIKSVSTTSICAGVMPKISKNSRYSPINLACPIADRKFLLKTAKGSLATAPEVTKKNSMSRTL